MDKVRQKLREAKEAFASGNYLAATLLMLDAVVAFRAMFPASDDMTTLGAADLDVLDSGEAAALENELNEFKGHVTFNTSAGTQGVGPVLMIGIQLLLELLKKKWGLGQRGEQQPA